MHRLIMENLGPIKKCDMNIEKFMILTGPQSSGKSTVAKAVFFFRTAKEDILACAVKYAALAEKKYSLKQMIEKMLRGKFLQTFGTSWTMEDMHLEYHYTASVHIKISLRDSVKAGEPNYIWVDLAEELLLWISKNEAAGAGLHLDGEAKRRYQEELENLFADPYETVFIPAGRSMITLLTSQLTYIFAMMDDSQRRMLDYCTQNYMERILKLKPLFESGIRGMLRNKLHLTQERVNLVLINKIMVLIDAVLQGKYHYVNGEERLLLPSSQYVKINFTSSGQQESVWILNLIFYYMLEQRPVFFIFEEPESHLYPEAQRLIAESISLAAAAQNQVMITTHSPYILGALNNLIYGHQIYQDADQKMLQLLKKKQLIKEQLLDIKDVAAFFVRNGVLRSCIDKELHMIDNAVIDGASENINELLEQLLDVAAKKV